MICIPFLTYVKFSSLFSLERYCRISIGTIGRCHLQWFREYWFRITHHDVETFWAGGAMWFSQMVQGAKALALTQWRIVIQCPSEVCIHDYDQMTNDTHSNVMRVHLNYLKHFSNFPLISHRNDGTIHITKEKPQSRLESRAVCEQINKQTANETIMVVEQTTGWWVWLGKLCVPFLFPMCAVALILFVSIMAI